MAKLIPGKIRTEGISFYEKGQISISEVKNRIIYSRVSDYNLRYSLADDAVFCSCEFFQKKQYCAHLADRKSTRLNSSHITRSRMPSSA